MRSCELVNVIGKEDTLFGLFCLALLSPLNERQSLNDLEHWEWRSRVLNEADDCDKENKSQSLAPFPSFFLQFALKIIHKVLKNGGGTGMNGYQLHMH